MTVDPRLEAHEPDAERYAAGRMKESEELAFETRMLEEPALAREVAAIQGIREGFRVLSAQGALPQAISARHLGPLYALAAILALCLIGSALFMTSRTSPPVLANTRLPGVTHTIFLTQTRGPEQVPGVPGSGVTEVRVLPAVAGTTDQYRVTLERMKDAVLVASSVDVRSDASGYVTLYVDGARLAPGRYRLSLKQGEAQEQLLFAVLPAE